MFSTIKTWCNATLVKNKTDQVNYFKLRIYNTAIWGYRVDMKVQLCITVNKNIELRF